MSDPIFTVTAQAIVALDLFRFRDSDCGQITGINVRPDGKGGALLVAMDVHMCALLHEPFSSCEAQVTITPSVAFVRAMRDAVKASKKNPVPLVRFDGERLSLLSGDDVIMDQHDSCMVDDGKDYPSISFVQAAQELRRSGYKASSLVIPCDSMQPFQKAATVYGAADGKRSLFLYPSGPGNPCLVRMDCNENFLGVVMPMHVEGRSGDTADALEGFEGLDAY